LSSFELAAAFLLRDRIRYQIRVAIMTAAAPNPAPSPAASAMLEPPLSLLAVTFAPSVADSDAAACVAVDPEEGAMDVVVPSVFKGCSVNAAVVLVIPGQLVLPMTVTVVG
jgi:hypothetical protein